MRSSTSAGKADSSSRPRPEGTKSIQFARAEEAFDGHDGELGGEPAASECGQRHYGLGLFRARRIFEAHDGSFAVDLIPKLVLVTTVALPARRLPAASNFRHRSRDLRMTAENRRILIIDDERPILMTLEALLGRHGYQPETAAKPRRGIAPAREKNRRRSSCSICNCPTRTAWKCSNRSKREHPDTQVIILTAHDSSEQRDRIDQARRLSLHQQTVRAGRTAQSGRESAGETIAAARNAGAAGEDAAAGKTTRNRRRRDLRRSSRARRCRKSTS